MTFAAEFAARRGTEVALCDAAGDWTWARADALLRPLANGILAAELGSQRRVAIFAENSAETLLCHVAVTLAGCSGVPVNFHLTADEVAYILADAGVSLVLADGSTAERAVDAARMAGVPLVVARGMRTVPGAVPWQEWLDAAGDADPPTTQPPLPTLVYTSGTTGKPKGTPLPPSSFVGGETVAEHVRLLGQTSWAGYGRHLVVGPMYHSGPLTATRLFAGGVPVTVLGKFDAESVLVAIDRDRIGSAIMVPTHFVRLLALPDEVKTSYDCSSLTYVLQVGSKCPADVKRAVIDWWGEVVWESYGGSEVGTTCLISAKEWLEHPGSVGRAIPPFEALIVDAYGREVPPGVEGRLFFRDATGRGVKYHNAPEKEAGVHLAPGVFTLGEIGYRDADGYVFVTDRFSDMVVSGGVNIYPAESEQVLAQHHAVAEVACIGVPHAEMGEELKAVVVPADPTMPPSAEDLLEFCRARLARYKCPRSVDFAEELPRSAMGKLDKRPLRDRYRVREAVQ